MAITNQLSRPISVILLLVVVSTLGIGAVAGTDPPVVPAAYYGEIELNGEDAADGIVIEAEIDNEVRGNIITKTGGYGGPDARDSKLVVNGSTSDVGSEVTFYASGTDFARVKLDQTVNWESGVVQRVDLSGEVDTDDSNGNGDEGNGEVGGGGGGSEGGTTEEETADGDDDVEEDDTTERETEGGDDDVEEEDITEEETADGDDDVEEDDTTERETEGGDDNVEEEDITEEETEDGHDDVEEDDTTEDDDSDRTSDNTPGFGIVITILAVLSLPVFFNYR